MRLSTVFAGINLARKVVTTLNRDPQDIPEVLQLVNSHAARKCNGALFCDRVGGIISAGFQVKGRGYDAEPLPGFPTCWIWCPNGYRFKVALDSEHRDILDEDTGHMNLAQG
ncbi:MAG: hypothetical protein AAFV85_23125 [Cyanobacteria bacterium J06634_6]